MNDEPTITSAWQVPSEMPMPSRTSWGPWRWVHEHRKLDLSRGHPLFGLFWLYLDLSPAELWAAIQAVQERLSVEDLRWLSEALTDLEPVLEWHWTIFHPIPDRQPPFPRERPSWRFRKRTANGLGTETDGKIVGG